MSLDHINEADKAELIQAAKQAAMATAHLWDILHKHEETGEFVDTSDMVSTLAGGLEVPPSPEDLDDDLVWEAIERAWRKI